LKQWDKVREIPRDYQQLSISDKQKLLSYLAFRKFEQPDNFILFEQNEIEGYIAEHLGIEAEESETLLKAIEAHHGLLIERAQGFWSFSHLTFQEYFTAHKIVTSCNEYAVDDPTLQALVSHLTENRWREVFLLTVQMLDSPDVLLRLMKQKVNSLISNDKNLQLFFYWICFKSLTVFFYDKVTYYKLLAIRIFYFCLVLTCEFEIFRYDEAMDLADKFHVHVQDISLTNDGLDFDLQLYLLLEMIVFSGWFSPKDALARDIDNILDYFQLPPNFKTKIKKLKDNLPQLPDPEQEKEKFMEIWRNHRSTLTAQLRTIMIEHRHIGYDWQFSEEQLELLMQYYNANNFLLDCLNSGCNLSQEVRQEIEDTLLLPMSEIEK
jgi:hypothetical protein